MTRGGNRQGAGRPYGAKQTTPYTDKTKTFYRKVTPKEYKLLDNTLKQSRA